MTMAAHQQLCLRWDHHQGSIISSFVTLLESETLVDCTLAAEGRFLKAHKIVLSACSPYFAALISQQYDKHPVFILKDVKFHELRAIIDYMYQGELHISQDQLTSLLKTAESLQIKGFFASRDSTTSSLKPLDSEILRPETSENKNLLKPIRDESNTTHKRRKVTEYQRTDEVKQHSLGSSESEPNLNPELMMENEDNQMKDVKPFVDLTLLDELYGQNPTDQDADRKQTMSLDLSCDSKSENDDSNPSTEGPNGEQLSDLQNYFETTGHKAMIMEDGLQRFLCPQCGVKYKKLSYLRSHMKECGKGAQCPLCPKIVTQRRNLPKHMETHRQGLVVYKYMVDSD
ncbi:protein bric-a-brac 1-like [Wyeomyia smithii]|uniref:protein bric-a-brac 1-like n=1 Tax=Wyeomyia smithii TaxID=174621 RepID=UPI0024680123|nr:protein bric-a-brac 1-like [Wyeomyia smithii]XP_055529753.1 protein bric-a-brac 1-like [Wyeomyia smithii]XP_055529754.1 protein bric-a-brac 1-like [Wyeomyia smithii]